MYIDKKEEKYPSKTSLVTCVILLIIFSILTITFFLIFTPPKTHIDVKEKEKRIKGANIPIVDEYGGSYLHSIGEKVRQKDWGTFTLQQTYPINKTFKISSMAIQLKEIKMIKLSQINEERKEELREFTGLSFTETYALYYKDHLSIEEIYEKEDLTKRDIEKEITYIEISYTVENTSLNELQFYSMENVSFNNHLHYNVPEKNFIYSGDTIMGTKRVSRIDNKANEEREGLIGLLIDPGKNINKLTSFSFTTSDILDGNSHDLLTKAKTFTISLN